ncbi:MAG: plastocyanin [Ferruginibacter sp.]|nr:plastocyanin [Rhodoferax sp.]
MAAALVCSISAQAASLLVVVVDKDGKPTPDAVVAVVPAARGLPQHAPPLQAVVNQEKMQFIPAVTVVSPGARIRFINNDAWDHHVRMSPPGAAALAAPSGAEGFSIRLEGKPDGKPAKFAEVTLDKAGVTGASLLGCFIHGSMTGNIFVADSPWTVKTDENGLALLDDLPDGPATVQVWHAVQLVDMPLQKVSLGAVPVRLTVQLNVVPRRRRG